MPRSRPLACLLVAAAAAAAASTTSAFVPLSLTRRTRWKMPPLGSTITEQSPKTTTSKAGSVDSDDTASQSSQQNWFGIASDAVTGLAFSLLHAFDADPIQDSSKNLRVLWVRALLHQAGRIDDPIAQTFLPPTTRGLVTTDAGLKLLGPLVRFTEWIEARTAFIDSAAQHFLAAPVQLGVADSKPPRQMVLFGAGYDTRALRFRHENVSFFEVDLPQVVKDKALLYRKFQQAHDPEWDAEASTLIGLDFNDCGGETPVSLLQVLQDSGWDPSLPTLFVWEAVLFYVDADAVGNILGEVFAHARTQDTMVCLTDSLKPFVTVPFSNEARTYFADNGMQLLEHRSRWGGAVHFCLAASSSTQEAQEEPSTTLSSSNTGRLAAHVSKRVGGLVNSYTPTQANNKVLLDKPSFEKVWYAVAYPWQIDGYETPLDAVLGRRRRANDDNKDNKPFSTRLWGEPLVIYRDDEGQLVAMADVCPHRSAPLSMGRIHNNRLVCAYHGWEFGKGGQCEHVPVMGGGSNSFPDRVSTANCGNLRAVVEHEGLVYVWRGPVLEADLSLLPTRRTGGMETVPIDTVLDYNVDYSYIVENNLDSPHLFYLHDGSVPPIESIGMLKNNLPKLKLKAFQDDCGVGHLGSIEKDGRPKKLIRFDPPNIVRHGGVSGFEEEFHVIPIAPQRTRVLLRQHLPRGPILSTVTSIPGVLPLLTLLVNNWNYHIALEDSNVMQGQAHRIEDWGSPRMAMGGLGDDLIKRFWKWRSKAHEALGEGQTPYMTQFRSATGVDGAESAIPATIPSGTAYGDDPVTVQQIRRESQWRNAPLATDNQSVDLATGKEIGSWGIKFDYLQNTPPANFPPTNYRAYAKMLVLDSFVKRWLFQDDHRNSDDEECLDEAAERVLAGASHERNPVVGTAAAFAAVESEKTTKNQAQQQEEETNIGTTETATTSTSFDGGVSNSTNTVRPALAL